MLSKIRTSWPTLLVEGLAVLVGVLLAFWVESLGQARSDQQKVEAHLRALDSELARNSELVERRIESGRRSVAATEHYLATVVLPGADVDPDAIAVTGMLEGLGPPALLEFQRGALDDILSGGGLPLVTSDSIRTGVLTYARLLADEASTQQAAGRFWSDQIGPYLLEHGSILTFMSMGEELALDALPPEVGAFVRSRHFSNLLAERRYFELRLLLRRDRLKAQMDRLSALLR